MTIQSTEVVVKFASMVKVDRKTVLSKFSEQPNCPFALCGLLLLAALIPLGGGYRQDGTQTNVSTVVIDGWGIPTEKSPPEGDAIAAADTPVMSGFADKQSTTAQGYTELDASSLAVGLPEGLMGNSEVGHLNIGAGRVVWQDVRACLSKMRTDHGSAAS